MKVCTPSELGRIVAHTISHIGLPLDAMRENAANAVCTVIQQYLKPEPNSPIIIVCGQDPISIIGLIAARQLKAYGKSVTTAWIHPPIECSDDHRRHHEIALRCGVDSLNPNGSGDLPKCLTGAALVIDAVLGATLDASATGAGVVDAAIDAINASKGVVLALDVPSGVCGATGMVARNAVNATATIAFGLPKRGSVVPPGASRCGQLFVSPMCIPPHVLDVRDIDVEMVCPDPLPARLRHGHKGAFGDTLFIVGAGTYFGAPGLAAMASLRAGAGYARIACPASMTPVVASFAPEAVFVPQFETESGSISLNNSDALVALANKVDFVVLGPGISTDLETQQLVREIVGSIEPPLLIDGDGLTAIAGEAELLHRRVGPTVLTPHMGEMARLLGESVDSVARDPIEAAKTAAISMRAHVVLKGFHSIVASPNGKVTINTTGNDGMGTAGSGDVLTGTIAAMYGLGLPIDSAVRTGVYLHGLAGDFAMRDMGADGMTARDILGSLPKSVREYREARGKLLVHNSGACISV